LLIRLFSIEKKKLDSNHNFTSLVQDLSKSLKEIKRNSKKNLIDDNYFVKEEFSHLKKESVNNVISDIVQTNKVTVRLKDDVDRFAEYFNIKKIVEKQENKIKVQKKKLDDLDDYKVQSECIICMENERKVIFYPCLHLIACETCAFSKLQNDCPTCHKKIEKREYVLS